MKTQIAQRIHLNREGDLVDIDVLGAKLGLRLDNLLLQFIVCLRDIVECEDRQSQSSQEIASETYDGIERKLVG